MEFIANNKVERLKKCRTMKYELSKECVCHNNNFFRVGLETFKIIVIAFTVFEPKRIIEYGVVFVEITNLVTACTGINQIENAFFVLDFEQVWKFRKGKISLATARRSNNKVEFGYAE